MGKELTFMTTALPILSRTVRGAGPGLLLAHGAGGGIEANYGPILAGLAERYTVVGPDFPGTGGTARATEPISLDALADEMVAAAVAEGLETFAIAGYSMGGPVAIRAATRHPERVTALVLTASFARPNGRMRVALNLWRTLLDSPDHAPLAHFLALLGVGAPALDQMSTVDTEATLVDAGRSVPPGTPEHLDLICHTDVRADLPLIAVPTLVISTTVDALVTPYHHRQLADGIPGADFAELATGHLPFVERPTEWLSLIRSFLDRLPRWP
jgi:pimeloyl-ACP methyl ester carboxylesterase